MTTKLAENVAVSPSTRSRKRSCSWAQVFRTTYEEWSADRVPRLGAALAYYTIFSLAPMLIIVMAMAGFFFDPEQVDSALNGEFADTLGKDGAQAVSTLITAAHKPVQGVVATIVGLVVVVFGSLGVFVELKDALNTIWKVEAKPGRGVRGIVRDYVLSFTMVLGVGFLLIVTLVVNAVLSIMLNWVGQIQTLPAAAAYATELFASFLIVTLLFAMIFRVLPDARIAWRDVWLGAAVTSILFNLGKSLIGLYLGHATFGSAYGAAGTILIVLVWTYYSAQILFLGAEFTQVYARSCGKVILPSDGAISTRAEAGA